MASPSMAMLMAQTVHIEYRWGRGQYDQMPSLAAELVRLPATLLVAGAEPSVLAAKGSDVKYSDRLCGGHRSDQTGGRGEFQQARRQRHRCGYPDYEPGHKTTWTVARANSTCGYDWCVSESEISVRKSHAQPDTGGSGHAWPAYPNLSRQQSPEIDGAFDAISGEHIAAVSVTADPFFNHVATSSRTRGASRRPGHLSIPPIYRSRRAYQLRRRSARRLPPRRGLCRPHPKGEKPSDFRFWSRENSSWSAT